MCYIIKCWAHLERGTKEYHDAYLSEADMVGLSNELEWADAQRDKGLFNYSLTDSVFDAGTRDVIPVVANTAKTVTGGASVYSGGTLCGTVAGCFFGGPMIVFGLGNIEEGTSALYNHVNNEEGSYNHVKQTLIRFLADMGR